MRLTTLIIAAVMVGCTAPPTGDPVTSDNEPGSSALASKGGVANEPPIDDQFKLSVFKWDGPLDATGKVRVQNPYGDIRTRSSGEKKLYVSAQIQTFTNWQDVPTFDVREVDGVTEVRIKHAHPGRASYGGDYNSGLAGRVDITLLLPDGASLDATTTDGAIRVKGFTGSVKARTSTGELYYKSTGSLDLATDSGAVEAVVRHYDKDMAMRIFTVSGPVHLRMTPEVSALVAMTTAGAIDTAIMEGVKADQRRLKDGYEIALGGQQRLMRVGSRTGAVQISVDTSFSTDQAADQD